jgi:putative peptidoglycan lipid II flippase
MVAQLWIGSRKMGSEAALDDRFRQRFPRIVGASALMGLVLYLGAWGLQPLLEAHLWRFAALALLIGLGIVSYFGSGIAMGAFGLSDFARLRRGKGGGPPPQS